MLDFLRSERTMRKLGWILLATLTVFGVALVAVSVYIRAFMMGDDPFDPLREVSMNCLFGADFCCLSVVLTAQLMR